MSYQTLIFIQNQSQSAFSEKDAYQNLENKGVFLWLLCTVFAKWFSKPPKKDFEGQTFGGEFQYISFFLFSKSILKKE